MSAIPCLTCERKSECIRDRRCNNPRSREKVMREWEDALTVFRAAAKRLATASAAVVAMYPKDGAIDGGRQS